MTNRYTFPRALVSALVSAGLLGGCASPYVTLSPRAEAEGTRPAVLGDAISQAQSVQAQYRAKVIELGEGERLFSNSLLGLGTLILGMGVAKTHSSAITGTTLVAGSVYTFGTFNTDKRRAMIYVTGMKALECAANTVTPLVLAEGQEQRLIDERRSMAGATGRVSAALGEAERWSARARAADAMRFKDGIDAVALAVAAAQAAVGRADDAVDQANQRLTRPYQLAKELQGAVKSIDRAVLEEIRGTENALQAVHGIVAGIQGNASLFSLQSLAPAPAVSAAAETAPKPKDGSVPKSMRPATMDVAQRDDLIVENLSAALGKLRAETVTLASEAARLSRAAATSPPQAVSDTLKSCQVEGTVRPISASPATVTFTAKTSLTQSILVEGGNGNYTAGFLQTPTPGLVPTIRPRSKGVVDIVASNQTVAGQTYQLVIEDTTQQSRQIVTVVIAAASGDSTSTADAATSASDVDKAIAEVKAAKKLTLSGGRTVMVVDVTKLSTGHGIAVSYTVVGDAIVTPDEVAAAAHAVDDLKMLLGAGPDVVTAAVAKTPHSGKVNKSDKPAQVGHEATLKSAEIKVLQLRLCTTADGAWGPASRAALKADRQRLSSTDAKRPALDDPLTEQEAKRYLALPDADAAARCKVIRP